MPLKAKAFKLAHLSRRPRWVTALAKHGVAAAVEHDAIVRWCRPGTLIDVGANKGQFSLLTRERCPAAVIHAFEPLPEAGDRFSRLFAGDARVTLHRVALGAEEGTHSFFVTDQDDSSSLLRSTKAFNDAYHVHEAAEIKVEVRRLASVLDVAALPGPVMLKLDVQGAELAVLQGMSLDGIDMIYAELSFIEFYAGAPDFEAIRAHLRERGFVIRAVVNQVFTEAYGPSQADVLFMREGAGLDRAGG